MQVMGTSSTPRYAVASSRAQRDGTEYQAPSILTIARELISTGMGLCTSKLVAGAGSSCTRSSAPSSLAALPVRCRGGERGVEFGEQLARDCFQTVAARNRSEML